MKIISSSIRNQRGQTLIEYLIIVALVGIGSIGLVKAVSKQVNAKFSHVLKSLDGKVTGSITNANVSTASYKNMDMSNFQSAALDKDNKNRADKNETHDD